MECLLCWEIIFHGLLCFCTSGEQRGTDCPLFQITFSQNISIANSLKEDKRSISLQSKGQACLLPITDYSLNTRFLSCNVAHCMSKYHLALLTSLCGHWGSGSQWKSGSTLAMSIAVSNKLPFIWPRSVISCQYPGNSSKLTHRLASRICFRSFTCPKTLLFLETHKNLGGSHSAEKQQQIFNLPSIWSQLVLYVPGPVYPERDIKPNGPELKQRIFPWLANHVPGV